MIECIKIKADKCIACRRCEVACMEVCPVQALYLLEPDGNVIEMPKPQKKAVEK